MNQIICMSTSPWYPYPTRKQHVMSRLSDAEILYFDPPITCIAPLKDRTLWKKLTDYTRAPQKPQENITVYALPPVLPFFNKFRWINRLNQRRIARFVRAKAAKHGFVKPLLWTYSPTSCDLVGKIPAQGVVYDCVDRHSGYWGFINPAVVDAMEADLARSCDAVFATAKGLCDTLAAYNPTAMMIPNGANYEVFARAQDSDLPLPEALAGIATPIIGYVGTLMECIDIRSMAALAQAHPDYTLVCIGKTAAGADTAVLRQYPNVKLLGLMPQEKLPEYVAHFDVCINPFLNSSLSKDVSPLKFYEYLATGKPVVATPQPEQVLQYRDAVYIADGTQEFIRCCEQAVEDSRTGRDAEKRTKRIAYAKQCSWDSRVEQISARLYELGLLE